MKKLIVASMLLASSSFAFAASAPDMSNPDLSKISQVTIMTQCRLASAHITGNKLAENKQFVLFKTTAEELSKLRNIADHAKDNCGFYMDVTNEWSKTTSAANAKALLEQFTKPAVTKLDADPLPSTTNYPNQVQATQALIQPTRMWSDLAYITNPTNFTDRSAYSANGVRMAEWLKSTVDTLAAQYPNVPVQTKLYETGGRYKQPSLVMKIGNSTNAAVVIGAHMDTMGQLDMPIGNKPGADDDGSGSVTVLELTRALLASNLTFNRPIYVMWYAAEERGLIGSGVVSKYFSDQQIPVYAVLQMDMTGYVNKGELNKLWLMTDNSDSGLTSYLGLLATTYTNANVLAYTKCGYACSDHASWTQRGVRAAMASESSFNEMNPNIHTSTDTPDHLSIDQMTKFVNLAAAFAVELAGPQS